ncbi:hypothetical protein [Chitinophaga sp. LS1]|uniref:hypothetical protein n=1 Tax=Chitinophaga sp. LS1 TaxID=3051176 RepID=UPI002AABC24B|nr:hypothetical protein [Chitinophaga sp. LS1]WPV65936.1 hypothetical protein QQL36_29485 [Chitinophaga sp. LS1]
MDKKTQRLLHLIKEAQQTYGAENLVIALPGYAAKKFIAYCSIQEDLQLLIEYTTLLKTKPEGTVASALTYSLIALYGKCFTDASKHSYPKLEPNDLFENNKLKDVHEYLMDLRHQFIAHRGETEAEIGISFMLIPKNKELSDKTELRFSRLKMINFSKEEISKIEELLNYLLQEVHAKIEKAAQKLHDHLLTEFTPEQLNLMRMDNMK